MITRATSRFESRSESRSECHRRQARPEARRGSQAARPSRGARRPPRSSPVRPPPDPACGPSMHRRLGGRNAVESGDSRATLGRGTRPHRSLPPPCSSLGPARLRCPCRVRRHSQKPEARRVGSGGTAGELWHCQGGARGCRRLHAALRRAREIARTPAACLASAAETASSLSSLEGVAWEGGVREGGVRESGVREGRPEELPPPPLERSVGEAHASPASMPSLVSGIHATPPLERSTLGGVVGSSAWPLCRSAR